jgi:radical SAM protein with 4Fe4S-binding SPASM domain
VPLPEPQNAIVAVTLNCNARCQMCDIWKNDMHGEVGPEIFGRLPKSLRDVNISGGEPFLRSDLPQILAAIKTTNPKARLVISTNGFQPGKTRKLLPDLLRVDPKLAVRVSIDGMNGTHDEVRGIPGGFKKCVETLDLCREAGVTDLGIGFTLLQRNVHELDAVHRFAEDRHLQLAISVATDSSIYFGAGKEAMRPRDSHAVRAAFSRVIDVQLKKWDLKENFRGWFNGTLMRYHETNERPFACDGASGFFYMDSFGDVYLCHILSVKIGSLARQSWDELWASHEAEKARGIAATCDKCWLVCTGKAQIWDHKWQVGAAILRDKLAAHLRR